MELEYSEYVRIDFFLSKWIEGHNIFFFNT